MFPAYLAEQTSFVGATHDELRQSLSRVPDFSFEMRWQVPFECVLFLCTIAHNSICIVRVCSLRVGSHWLGASYPPIPFTLPNEVRLSLPTSSLYLATHAPNCILHNPFPSTFAALTFPPSTPHTLPISAFPGGSLAVYWTLVDMNGIRAVRGQQAVIVNDVAGTDGPMCIGVYTEGASLFSPCTPMGGRREEIGTSRPAFVSEVMSRERIVEKGCVREGAAAACIGKPRLIPHKLDLQGLLCHPRSDGRPGKPSPQSLHEQEVKRRCDGGGRRSFALPSLVQVR